MRVWTNSATFIPAQYLEILAADKPNNAAFIPTQYLEILAADKQNSSAHITTATANMYSIKKNFLSVSILRHVQRLDIGYNTWNRDSEWRP